MYIQTLTLPTGPNFNEIIHAKADPILKRVYLVVKPASNAVRILTVEYAPIPVLISDVSLNVYDSTVAFDATFDAYQFEKAEISPTTSEIDVFNSPAFMPDGVITITHAGFDGFITPDGIFSSGNVGILNILMEFGSFRHMKVDLASRTQIGTEIFSNAGEVTSVIGFSEDGIHALSVYGDASIRKILLNPFSFVLNVSPSGVALGEALSVAVGLGSLFHFSETGIGLYSQATLLQTSAYVDGGGIRTGIVSASLETLYAAQKNRLLINTGKVVERLDPDDIALIDSVDIPDSLGVDFPVSAIDDVNRIGLFFGSNRMEIIELDFTAPTPPLGFVFMESLILIASGGSGSGVGSAANGGILLDSVRSKVFIQHVNGTITTLLYVEKLEVESNHGVLLQGNGPAVFDSNFDAFQVSILGPIAGGFRRYVEPLYTFGQDVAISPPFPPAQAFALKAATRSNLFGNINSNFGILSIYDTLGEDRYLAHVDLAVPAQVEMVASLIDGATGAAPDYFFNHDDGVHFTYYIEDGQTFEKKAEKWTFSPFAPTGVVNLAVPITMSRATAGAGFFYFANGNVIYKMDQGNLQIVLSTPTTGTYYRLAFDTGHNKLYGVDSSTNKVTRFDPVTLQVIDEIAVPTGSALGSMIIDVAESRLLIFDSITADGLAVHMIHID